MAYNSLKEDFKNLKSKNTSGTKATEKLDCALY